jgi:hypothetical protein
MRISNVKDFYHFIAAHGLTGLNTETQSMISCMESYGRMCPCDPPATREAQFNRCKQLYIGFARKANGYKNQIMAKIPDASIEFSNDGQYISTVSRH